MNPALITTQSQHDADAIRDITDKLAQSLEEQISHLRPYGFHFKYPPTCSWSVSDFGTLIITISAQLTLPL